MRMPGNSHNAENIKIAIETMVSHYVFKFYMVKNILIVYEDRKLQI